MGVTMILQIRNNRTLRELMAGSVIYGLIWEAALLIFTERKIYHSIGLTIGIIISLWLAASIANSLDIGLELDEKSARAYVQRKASIRYLAVCAVFVILAILDAGNPLTCFAGVMGLKVGAYMQPLLRKMMNKKGDETIDG